MSLSWHQDMWKCWIISLGIKPNFRVFCINLLGWRICIANAAQAAVIAKEKHDRAILEGMISALIRVSEVSWAPVIRKENSQVANSFENYQTVGKKIKNALPDSPAQVQMKRRVTLFKAAAYSR